MPGEYPSKYLHIKYEKGVRRMHGTLSKAKCIKDVINSHAKQQERLKESRHRVPDLGR